jgi:hypothetical protein
MRVRTGGGPSRDRSLQNMLVRVPAAPEVGSSGSVWMA